VPEVTINLETKCAILTKFDISFEEMGKRCNFN